MCFPTWQGPLTWNIGTTAVSQMDRIVVLLHISSAPWKELLSFFLSWRPLYLVFMMLKQISWKTDLNNNLIRTASIKWNREYKQITWEYRTFEQLPQDILWRTVRQALLENNVIGQLQSPIHRCSHPPWECQYWKQLISSASKYEFFGWYVENKFSWKDLLHFISYYNRREDLFPLIFFLSYSLWRILAF